MRILVAEDDAPLADFLCQELQKEQFAVPVVADGIEAQELALNQHYDLVILGLVLLGAWAWKSCADSLQKAGPSRAHRNSRRKGGRARRGLDAGADDYVAKPFVFAELSARIRAVLRRGSRPARAVLQIADLELERVTTLFNRGGHEIALSPKEYALLEFLMRNAGQPVPAPRLSSKSGSLDWTP